MHKPKIKYTSQTSQPGAEVSEGKVSTNFGKEFAERVVKNATTTTANNNKMHTTVHYLLCSSTLLYSTRYETSPTTRRPSCAVGNIPYYSVSQSTATYSDLLLPTIKYYSVALRTANVLLRTTQYCFEQY